MMSACITLGNSSSFIPGEAVNTPRPWFASTSWSPRRKSESLFYRSGTPPKIVALSKITGARKPSGGITQPRPVSPAMQTFLGVKEISRTQALKQIWGYIKDNNLQF